jgi:hypothetical protein
MLYPYARTKFGRRRRPLGKSNTRFSISLHSSRNASTPHCFSSSWAKWMSGYSARLILTLSSLCASFVSAHRQGEASCPPCSQQGACFGVFAWSDSFPFTQPGTHHSSFRSGCPLDPPASVAADLAPCVSLARIAPVLLDPVSIAAFCSLASRRAPLAVAACDYPH